MLAKAFRAINRALPDDYFSRLQAAYWWLADHHRGQFTPEYRALCAVGKIYRPGPLENGTDELSTDAYNDACDACDCKHERLS